MAEVVQVQKREGSLGTAASRRLRKTGAVPAVLYGHKQSNEHLAISQKTVESILRHHSKIVELQGAVSETALVSNLQFDPLGIEVIHIDLLRVDMNERVNVTVPIQFKGEAKGGKLGGIVIENMHEVEIRCSAVNIPEYVRLATSRLDVGQSLTAAQLELPEGVELTIPTDTVICHVEQLKKGGDADEVAAASEPELIGKKEASEE